MTLSSLASPATSKVASALAFLRYLSLPPVTPPSSITRVGLSFLYADYRLGHRIACSIESHLASRRHSAPLHRPIHRGHALTLRMGRKRLRLSTYPPVWLPVSRTEGLGRALGSPFPY